jgi:short-subunit dehydrogenase
MAHVAITGASSGIGEALVREFVGAGHAVSMVARRRELLEALQRVVSGRTHVVAADLSDPAQALAWLAAAEAELGPIEVLVNYAGVQYVEPTAEVSAERARALLEVDLLAPLALVGAVLPAMLERGSGTIVNMASVAALVPVPGMAHYNAAKAGLAAASESLRGELRRSGVNVVTVYPGPIDTPMARLAYDAYPPTVTRRLMKDRPPAELARRVRRAVERRRGRLVYPATYHWTRWLPALARAIVDAVTPLPRSRRRD